MVALLKWLFDYLIFIIAIKPKMVDKFLLNFDWLHEAKFGFGYWLDGFLDAGSRYDRLTCIYCQFCLIWGIPVMMFDFIQLPLFSKQTHSLTTTLNMKRASNLFFLGSCFYVTTYHWWSSSKHGRLHFKMLKPIRRCGLPFAAFPCWSATDAKRLEPLWALFEMELSGLAPRAPSKTAWRCAQDMGVRQVSVEQLQDKDA